jgi:hypothetical protein
MELLVGCHLPTWTIMPDSYPMHGGLAKGCWSGFFASLIQWFRLFCVFDELLFSFWFCDLS